MEISSLDILTPTKEAVKLFHAAIGSPDVQEIIVGQSEFDRIIEEQNRARQEETFVQAVVRNMFPRPLQPYGNALWLIGRQHVMFERGILK
jgi:hypothetical protein